MRRLWGLAAGITMALALALMLAGLALGRGARGMRRWLRLHLVYRGDAKAMARDDYRNS